MVPEGQVSSFTFSGTVVSLGRFLTSSVIIVVVECLALYVLVRGALDVLIGFVDLSVVLCSKV